MLFSGAPSLAFDPTIYIAFGDSITDGWNAAGGQGYVDLLNASMGTSLTNYGHPGATASSNGTVSEEGVFTLASGGSGSTPSLTANTIYTYAYGTNDANGGPSKEAVFDLCQLASIAWLATPITSKVLAQSASKTGTWVDDTSPVSGNGTSSTVSGSTLTFSITTEGKPIYIWYRAIDSSTGTFTYNLDGSGAVALSTDHFMGNGGAWILCRITGVSAGSHSLVLTVTSSGQTIDIWAIGSPPAASYANKMRTLVNNVIRRQFDAAASDTLAYSNDVVAQVALLQGDGLPVTLVDGRSAVNTTTDMDDEKHPNTTGHAHLATAFIAVAP